MNLSKPFKNKNFIRAALIYGTSLVIGVVGFAVCRWAIGGKVGADVGWWFLTCSPGFGTGVALALLNNGHKKPVTLRSAITTIAMIGALTIIMIFLNAPLLALGVGCGLNFVGATLGLWFCRFENKRETSAKEMIEINLKGAQPQPKDKKEHEFVIFKIPEPGVTPGHS